MWHIWKSRNAWSFNNESTDPPNIVAKALSEYNEYLDVVLANSSNANFQETSDYQVRVSEDGICLFVDAGLQVESKKASIGLVAMDSIIARVFCFMPINPRYIQFVGKSMTAEACAIRKCVEKVIQHGWRKLYVLSDAKGCCRCIEEKREDYVGHRYSL
ncbi:hypothetical protein RDI58_026505 [Solanum bulbocastanum]|uniref:RNase H type-1 domain-containing protein n=1 Tax=Solanum bulbocastanum TaxID=147425 RepID=A0AAN8SX14_SOLBU